MLPNDIARCEGYKPETNDWWIAGCEDCQRRTSPKNKGGFQWNMSPPETIELNCEYRIEP